MKLSVKNVVLLALMVLSAVLAASLRPTITLASERTPIKLQAMVPTAFGDWQEERNVQMQIVDPQRQQTSDMIYSETLSRTYVNGKGYRIMLSIAYGTNQSKALQLHTPELCYPAQGFTLLDKQSGRIGLLGGHIATVRLETNLGQRHEPLTYWTVVGDHNVTGGVDKKLTEMRYALNGRIPDGMLVRVSSIDTGTENAYVIQGQFAAQMVQAIAPGHRNRFAGEFKSN
jgi:EpsI family protein